MSKTKTVYTCQACGYTSLKWLGKCPDCAAWNTFVEEVTGRKSGSRSLPATSPTPLSEIILNTDNRISTHIGELDRVLGGGVVAGSVVLIGGDPGVGKSTLILQAMAQLLRDGSEKCLYISGEESASQLKLRASRLGIDSDNILVLSETSLEMILGVIKETEPAVVVIDSIQTTYSEELQSAPGTVGQVRECSARLMIFAKKHNIPTFIIGHVTKEGAIAGPRVLEHIVDTVLYFEGDRSHSFRILRTVKNRFGSTNEIGVFEMTDSGLMEIENPSELFLRERPADAAGSVATATIEGTRPLIVEIQALVSPTTFGVPRRTSIGVDSQRVNLLIAVLEKIGGLHLGLTDIYVNVVGGLRIAEPATDLPIILSIASSLREIPLPNDLFVFGEVGLSGEIRAVNQAEVRLNEGEKIGFKKAIIPESNLRRLKHNTSLQVTGVGDIHEAIEAVLHQ
ncbi:MAG: DNA repair protein RadA [Nitrospirota bacterium]|nr:DNA repair protein RadA [Nitrospirota bacterium]